MIANTPAAQSTVARRCLRSAAERGAVPKAVEYLPKTSHTSSDPYDIALIALAKLTAKEDASWEIERYIG
jgi:hypothetical protein